MHLPSAMPVQHTKTPPSRKLRKTESNSLAGPQLNIKQPNPNPTAPSKQKRRRQQAAAKKLGSAKEMFGVGEGEREREREMRWYLKGPYSDLTPTVAPYFRMLGDVG